MLGDPHLVIVVGAYTWNGGDYVEAMSAGAQTREHAASNSG
jgi:hypothetical protein